MTSTIHCMHGKWGPLSPRHDASS